MFHCPMSSVRRAESPAFPHNAYGAVFTRLRPHMAALD